MKLELFSWKFNQIEIIRIYPMPNKLTEKRWNYFMLIFIYNRNFGTYEKENKSKNTLASEI